MKGLFIHVLSEVTERIMWIQNIDSALGMAAVDPKTGSILMWIAMKRQLHLIRSY